MSKEHVIEAVLTLPEKDRLEIAERLYESLEAWPDPEVDEAWAREIERRMQAADSGESKPVPWEEAFKIISDEHDDGLKPQPRRGDR